MKSYNIIRTTEHPLIKTIYYKGTLKSKTRTPMGHLFISAKDVKMFKVHDHVQRYIDVHNSDNYNFMIPKRRLAILNEFDKEAIVDMDYIFKLEQESRSGKMMVCEIFIA